MFERRRSFRRRTLLEGQIEIARLNGWVARCTVRDLSAAGARIVIHDGAVVPPSFALSVTGEDPKAVRMVWYRDGQAGVTTEETSDLDSASRTA